MKVGDYIILIKGCASYMDNLIGIPAKITEINVDEDNKPYEIHHDKMNKNKGNYFICADYFNVIPKEIVESPLFKLMKENE